MTQPAYGNLPAGYLTPKPVSFTAANGTVLKVLIEQMAASAAVGSLPPYFGGGTLLDLTANSTDGSNKDVQVYMGTLLTTQESSVTTGTITTSAQNTLTRTLGSWLAEGWAVGDQIAMFVPFGSVQVTAGLDGVLGTITAVSATVLTVNGTPWTAGANVLTAGTRFFAMALRVRATVPANAGTAGTTTNPSIQFVGNSIYDGTKVTTELKFGASNIIAAGMQAAVSALPAVVNLLPSVARY